LNLSAKEMLVRLSAAYGPPGREKEVRDLIREMVTEYVDEVYEDNSGNLVAVKKGNSKGKVMFSTHMDEVCMLVSRVMDTGFLKLEGVGMDPKLLPSQKVKIHTRSGEILRGVIGMLAPHLQTAETRSKISTFDELFVDVSMSDISKINVGDFVTFDTQAVEIGDYLYGKTLDDRASCVSSIVALKKLSKIKHEYDVYAVFSSREEIGAFGAKTAAHAIDPCYAIAVDVTHGNENVDNYSKVEVAKGPVVTFGPVIPREISKKLCDLADRAGIKIQKDAAPGRTGTDADQIQIEGIAVGLISIPQRYMHNPYEMISIKDVEETGRLMAEFVSSLDFEEKEEN